MDGLGEFYEMLRAGFRDPLRVVQRYSTFERILDRRMITHYGWRTTYVYGDGDGMAYTTGLWEQRHPELVIFGMPQAEAHAAFAAVSRGLREHGAPIEAGSHVQINDRCFEVFAVPNPDRVLLAAHEFYGYPSEPVPALQLVFADDAGRWPWEPGCSGTAARQPMPGCFDAGWPKGPRPA